MADSKFLISIVRADGDPILLKPGGHGERDLVQKLVERVISKNVGYFRSEAVVEVAVREAATEVLRELKSEVSPS